MIEAIEDIRHHFGQGSFPNEASISQGVVLRILSELGWPTFNPAVVWPEYFHRGLRIDYALCVPPRRPYVLVEVKQPGLAINAEEQLFQYAFHQGAPLVVLTTGQEWQFFLPAEPGSYVERRVYMLDIMERDPAESVERLRRYLDFERVTSGEALEAARLDYRDISTRRKVDETLPLAWRKLIEEADPGLVAMLSERVESLCGYRPDTHQVAGFLERAMGASPLALHPTATSSFRTGGGKPVSQRDTPTLQNTGRVKPEVNGGAPEQASGDKVAETSSGLGSDQAGVTGKAPAEKDGLSPRQRAARPVLLMFRGETIPVRTGNDVIIELFGRLTAANHDFPAVFVAKRPGTAKRPRLAPTREQVHPGNPDIAGTPSAARQIPGSNWWLDLHSGWETKERLIRDACEVAGLRFGEDVKISFDSES